MRRPIIAGNWKMYKTISEAIDLVNGLKRELNKIVDLDIAVCPPYIALSEISDMLTNSNIKLGAQDAHWEDEGAFTGEVSCGMLKDTGCTYVIIGHSERRKYFGETNESVNKKLLSCIKNQLIPIVCVGERLEEREQGRTFEVVKDHVEGAFKAVEAEDAEKAIIAYEPVWAIGTGKTATPQQAEEAHKYIRGLLKDLYGENISQSIRIQYGGSVKPGNIEELMKQEDVDGALVGGASLKLESFVEIVKKAI